MQVELSLGGHWISAQKGKVEWVVWSGNRRGGSGQGEWGVESGGWRVGRGEGSTDQDQEVGRQGPSEGVAKGVDQGAGDVLEVDRDKQHAALPVVTQHPPLCRQRQPAPLALSPHSPWLQICTRL